MEKYNGNETIWLGKGSLPGLEQKIWPGQIHAAMIFKSALNSTQITEILQATRPHDSIALVSQPINHRGDL